MSEERKIDRLPGRLVVSSLISMYLAFFSLVFAGVFEANNGHGGSEFFVMLAGLFASACLPLIFFAIILRLVSK